MQGTMGETSDQWKYVRIWRAAWSLEADAAASAGPGAGLLERAREPELAATGSVRTTVTEGGKLRFGFSLGDLETRERRRVWKVLNHTPPF